MLLASSTPGIDVMRIATFPLRATILPGAGAALFVSCVVAPGWAVVFEAIPGRSLFAAWFIVLLFEVGLDPDPMDPALGAGIGTAPFWLGTSLLDGEMD